MCPCVVMLTSEKCSMAALEKTTQTWPMAAAATASAAPSPPKFAASTALLWQRTLSTWC